MTKPFLFVIVATVISFSCLAQEDVFAWCIVPFDIEKRTPAQRIEMLKELGITSYAYDWRTEHLSSMPEEIQLAKENGIEINAVWMWLNAQNDVPDKLSADNEKIFETLKSTGLKTTLWVSFQPAYFQGLSDRESLRKGANMIYYLYQRLKTMDCKLALYNHGGWFGKPENQIRLIKTLGRYDIGLVYNFHHGHHHIKGFERLARKMVNYLVAVNVNGMDEDGPEILAVGKGRHEGEMIGILRKVGYRGPFGILGHQADQDVKAILEENLKGFRGILE